MGSGGGGGGRSERMERMLGCASRALSVCWLYWGVAGGWKVRGWRAEGVEGATP